MKSDATFSPCHKHRFTLVRQWERGPTLVVCMFNPSTANATDDDPTISKVCKIAKHNGYGGIVVVNGIPLRSSDPDDATAMTNWNVTQDVEARALLLENLETIVREVADAGAILIAWGALAKRCPSWFDTVLEAIESARAAEPHPEPATIYCLAKTKEGYPKHPKARGKHAVPDDAELLHWHQAPRL